MWKQDKLTNFVSHISVYSSVTPKIPWPGGKIAFTTQICVQAFDKYLFPTSKQVVCKLGTGPVLPDELSWSWSTS